MDFLAIIQARTGSSRLPNKVLLKLVDKTVLEHVINRVKSSKLVSDVVVATTLSDQDLDIVKICSKNNIKVYCGSENDVLDRFYQIVKILKPKNIVRITADCPVIDPEVIDLVISAHIKSESDYTSNSAIKTTFPDGEDVEVFTYNSLEKAYYESKLPSQREHVTPYINRNSSIFKLGNVENEIDLSDKRWTLDNKEDFDFLNEIFSNLYLKNNFFGMHEILDFIAKNPELENINKHIERNEGYKKSLLNDLKT